MTGWPHNAYVGQKVVCVDNSLHNPHGLGPSWDRMPELNEVLTIMSIIPYKGQAWKWPSNSLSFTFKEIRGKFVHLRFRPAQSTETGMSILKKLLVPNNQLEQV